MEITVILRQALLYGHIIVFALALATIIKEDARLLRARRIDPASLHATAKLVKWLLLALWVTGVPMLVMDIGTDVSLLLGNPKLLTKLIVVGALTLNGIILHLVAFPLITGKVQNPNRAATIAAMLGAVSTTSWLYASFVAVSRIVASYFSLLDFVLLYLLALALAVSFAVLVVRRRLALSLNLSDELIEIPAAQRHRLSALLIEIENAMFDRGDAHRRRRTNYLAQHNTMLVTMKTSELFDQLLLIANGDGRLVEEAIRVCARGPNEEADLKEVVDFILAERVAEPAAA
jgi:hypothetical protein